MPKQKGKVAKGPAAAGSGASMVHAHIQSAGAPLIAKLEEQVANLDKLSEEYLEQGLLGHHCQASEMRDKARTTLNEMRVKLGLAPTEAAAPAAPAPSSAASSKALAGPAAERPKAPAAASSGYPQEAPAAPPPAPTRSGADADPEEDDAWCAPASALALSSEAQPRYRWQAHDGMAALEVSWQVGAPREVEPEADVNEGAVRVVWGSSGWALTVPLGFCTDPSFCKATRKRKTGLLTLALPRVRPSPPPSEALTAALRSPDGHGHADGFFAAAEADGLRRHLLGLWRAGSYEPGEVEGRQGDGAERARSDEYLYVKEDDAAVAKFTRRLDKMVLELSREVPELQGIKLMRGRPMATVYAGSGSRYTPHFDAVGGDNGRVLTCILYLNPFWREGCGAELKLWPEAKTLARQGRSCEIAPLHGRLAAFLCDSRNLHEVLPVSDEHGLAEPRVAVSCWYYDSAAIPSLAECERTADAPQYG